MTARSSDWRPSPTVCRCCFAEGCYKDISTEYFWMGKREVYSEMLSDTFDVSISYSQSGGPNSHSRLICEPCISRLRDASDFKRQVQECERVFMQHLDPGSSSLQMESEAEQTVTVKEVKIERVKKEQELSDDDDFGDMPGFPDDDDDDLDDQPLTTLASKVPKKESVELMELLDDPKPEKRKSTRVKAVPVKKAKKTQSPKASVSKEEPKTEKKKKDAGPESAAWENAILLLKHSTAYPFQQSPKSLKCCFCKYRTSEHNPDEFRDHMDSVHALTDKAPCLQNPNRSMRRVDITNLKCRDCSNPFDSLNDLAKHLIDAHSCPIDMSEHLGLIPLKLERFRFACFICSETHATLFQLSRHAGKHFQRHVCNECGKNFETPKGLKKHETIVHSIHRFMCQACQMPFSDAAAKKEHLRMSKKCQSFKCKICNERFMCSETQQQHLEEVHGKEKETYVCPECGEVFDKRMNRYLHFKRKHTDDYKCMHCERKFSNKRSLADHIGRSHTFDQKYKCEICEKVLTDSKALKVHMTTHDKTLRHECPACDKTFPMKYLLKNHVKMFHIELLPSLFPREQEKMLAESLNL